MKTVDGFSEWCRRIEIEKEVQMQQQIEDLTACEIGRAAELPFATAAELRHSDYADMDMRLTIRGRERLLRLRVERAYDRWHSLQQVGSLEAETAHREWERHTDLHAEVMRVIADAGAAGGAPTK